MSAKITIELSEGMDEDLSEIAERIGIPRAEALEFALGILLDTLIEDDDGGDDDDGEPIPVEEAA